MTDDITDAEHRLQSAQLASDADALDRLIDDDASFTDPSGAVWSKADDLRAHRDGLQTLTRLDELELRTRVVGDTGITWLLAAVAGEAGGQPFAATVRYTRTWVRDDRGWTVVAAHASISPDVP